MPVYICHSWIFYDFICWIYIFSIISCFSISFLLSLSLVYGFSFNDYFDILKLSSKRMCLFEHDDSSFIYLVFVFFIILLKYIYFILLLHANVCKQFTAVVCERMKAFCGWYIDLITCIHIDWLADYGNRATMTLFKHIICQILNILN